MIDTMNYRTRTLMLDVSNVCVENCWPIALDIGYSSVKGFSPHSIFAFPAYAKNLGKNPAFYGEQEVDEILYRDGDTGDIWRVGRSAQKMIDDRDTGDSQLELFGRDRYYSQMFKVILRTGLALGILENGRGKYNEKPIYIQTGLPPAYLDEDKESLTGVIAGVHKFAIKTGRQRQYVNLELNILEKNIDVMSQPEGTLMNIVMNDQANSTPEARRYFQSNIIIFDAGFGTLDIFDIKDRRSRSRETFSAFGMREVLARTSKKIKEKTGVTIRSSAMQNALETGTVTVKRRAGLKVSSEQVDFSELLEASSEEVCREAVEKVMNLYSGLFDYQCLILTGGTCAAWEMHIRDYFKEVDGLSVVMGNENSPEIDIIFCNVRGYYMYLINSLRRQAKRKQG